MPAYFDFYYATEARPTVVPCSFWNQAETFTIWKLVKSQDQTAAKRNMTLRTGLYDVVNRNKTAE